MMYLLALLSLAAPTLAQTRAIPPSEIRANGDITFGNALKLSKRDADKTIITPDTLQFLGSASTDGKSGMYAQAAGAALYHTKSDRLTVSDQVASVSDGISDATSALNDVAATAAAGTKTLVINRPLFLASPHRINLTDDLNLVFEGKGSLSWNFGAVTAVRIDNGGRSYTGIPSAMIAGNAALGAITMQLYKPAVNAGGSGYAIGDLLTLVGGTGSYPTVKVTAVSGGAVTAVSINTRGALTALPTSRFLATGSSGKGATFTATYNVASIAISSGGTYLSGVVPAITFSGGSPQMPAVATAIGQQPTIGSRITAPPTAPIFGGYAWVRGRPNGGDVYGNWFGATAGTNYPSASGPDARAGIQAALESAGTVRIAPGWYNVAGTIYIDSFKRLVGAGPHVAANGALGVPASWAQAGTLLWGTGGGAGVVESRPSQFGANQIVVENLGIAAAPIGNYQWVGYFPGVYNSTLRSLNVLNNQAAGGAVAIINDSVAIQPNYDNENYGPVWTNTVKDNVFSAAGAVLLSDMSDSVIADNYLTGGTGTIERGANNRWSANMWDLSSGDCLLVAPRIFQGSVNVFTNLSFQFCGQTAIHVANGSQPKGIPMNTVFVGVNINNINTSVSDILFDNVTRVTMDAVQFGGQSLSPANIGTRGAVDFIKASVSGGAGSKTIGGMNTTLWTDNALTSGTTFNVGTAFGTGLQINSLLGSGSPLQITPGKVGAVSARINTSAVSQEYQTDGTTRWTVGGVVVSASVPIQRPNYTVGALPSCNSTIKGADAFVTDANAPTRGVAIIGGGSTGWPVFCNGSYWASY